MLLLSGREMLPRLIFKKRQTLDETEVTDTGNITNFSNRLIYALCYLLSGRRTKYEIINKKGKKYRKKRKKRKRRKKKKKKKKKKRKKNNDIEILRIAF